MKKILIFTLIVASLILSGNQLPPPMPSNFYGSVGARPGDSVISYVNGLPCGKATVFLYESNPVYTLSCDGGAGADGQTVTFLVNNVKSPTTGIYHTGTNQYLALLNINSFTANRVR